MTSEEMEKAILSEIDADPEAFSEASVCTIDPNTRVIIVPVSLSVFGTESDEKTNRIPFRCPRVVGDNVDLSNFQICINFRNANSEKDRYIVEDMMIDGDEITFSWSLSRKVTKYKGRVSFIVCALNVREGTIVNEWNTTLAFGTVLEGLEADEVNPDEEEKDIILQLLAMVDAKSNKALEEIEAAKNEAVKEVQSYGGVLVDQNLENEGQAADAKVTGDKIAQLRGDISDVNNATENPVVAGKVWTSTANGAGWDDPRGGSGISVTGATVGQTVKIAAVDDDGVPTAWEPVDFPEASDEQVSIAVRDYLDANPPTVTETDPNVPAWAKQPQKPTYNAAEVGALSAEALPAAINTALAQAKDSGEFNGKDGEPGPQGEQGPEGYTPVKGTDYWTEDDQEAIVQQIAVAMGMPIVGNVDANNNVILTGNLREGTYYIKYEDAKGTLLDIGTIFVDADDNKMEGYQPVEYIASSGTQYILTGITGHTGLRIEADAQGLFTVSADECLIGSHNGTHRCLINYQVNNRTWEFGASNYKYGTSSSSTDVDRHNFAAVIEEGTSTLSIDGTAAITITDTPSFDNGVEMAIFARYRGGTTFERLGAYKLYALKILDNGVTVRDFVPAVRISDNEVGLYDTVNSVFYTNDGTGTFTSGPNVQEV